MKSSYDNFTSNNLSIFRHKKTDPKAGFLTISSAFPLAKQVRKSHARSLFQRTKHFANNGATGTDGILANRLLFLADHVKQAIQRALRHIAFDAGLVGRYHASLGDLAHGGVIGTGQAIAVGDLLDD